MSTDQRAEQLSLPARGRVELRRSPAQTPPLAREGPGVDGRASTWCPHLDARTLQEAEAEAGEEEVKEKEKEDTPKVYPPPAPLNILEGLAASGLRALRYAQEVRFSATVGRGRAVGDRGGGSATSRASPGIPRPLEEGSGETHCRFSSRWRRRPCRTKPGAHLRALRL